MGVLMSNPTADGQVPPLVIDYDGSWIRVDLTADVDAWAETEVRLRLEAGGVKVKRRDLRRRADYLATMVRLATRTEDNWALYLLSPTVDGRIVTAASLVLVEIEPGDDAEPAATARRIVAPEGLPCIEPPELTDLQTPAGPAVRGRARIAGAEPQRNVVELLTYAWVFPGYPMAVALTSAFTDLVEAGQWRPSLDALAFGVALETNPGSAHD
jgi:hypothetical protein